MIAKVATKEDDEPPKLGDSMASAMKSLKEAKSGQKTQKPGEPKVIPLALKKTQSQSEPVDTITQEIQELLNQSQSARVALGIEAAPEYVEVPEPDPTAPAAAQSASAASGDDTEKLNLWLAVNTPYGYTEKIFTRPKAEATEDDWKVDALTGDRIWAPQRLRRVKQKFKVLDEYGNLRRKRSYALVPDLITRRTEMVELKPSGFSDRTFFHEKVVYGSDHCSALRSPYGVAKCVFLGSRYFRDKKYALGLKRTVIHNQEESRKSRKKLGKSSVSPPVLGRCLPTRSVHWLCTHPHGSRLYPEVQSHQYVDSQADRVNFHLECAALDALTYLEDNEVSIEEATSESILHHAPLWRGGCGKTRVRTHKANIGWQKSKRVFHDYLPPQRPSLDSRVREYLSSLDDDLPWSYDEKGEPDVEITPTKFEPSPAAKLLPSSPDIGSPLQRTMSGYAPWHINRDNANPFDVAAFYERRRASKREAEAQATVVEQSGAGKGNQSEPQVENVAYVKPDGFTLKTNHPITPEARSQVAHGVSMMKPQRPISLEVESVVPITPHAFAVVQKDGRTKLGSVANEDGFQFITDLMNRMLIDWNILSSYEEEGMRIRGTLPTDEPEDMKFTGTDGLSEKRVTQWNDLYQNTRMRHYFNPRKKIVVPPDEDVHQCRKNYRKLLETTKFMSLLAEIRAQNLSDELREKAQREWREELDQTVSRMRRERAELVAARNYEKRKPWIVKAELRALDNIGQRGRKLVRAARKLEDQMARIRKVQELSIPDEVAYLQRLGQKAKQRRLALRVKHWLNRAESNVKEFFGFGPQEKIAATPPTVGETSEGIKKPRDVTAPKAETEGVKKPRVPMVDPERNEPEEDSVILAVPEVEDARRIWHRMQVIAKNSGLTKELVDEGKKLIRHTSLAERAARRRENREDLVA